MSLAENLFLAEVVTAAKFCFSLTWRALDFTVKRARMEHRVAVHRAVGLFWTSLINLVVDHKLVTQIDTTECLGIEGDTLDS